MTSVFLSYASEDREYVRAMSRTLTSFGLEVWFDETELGGGEAWDQKIRKQIRECNYFMPVVSARTEARHEGYFRREWRLAAERTLDMADDHLFLLPVVIDDTDQNGARVPEKFLAVQWLRLPHGASTPAFEALCRRLVSGAASEPAAKARAAEAAHRVAPSSGAAPLVAGARAAGAAAGATAGAAAAGDPPQSLYPPFPKSEPGQAVHYAAQVIGWLGQSAWISFKRIPRWGRIVIYCWVAVALLARACSDDHEVHTHDSDADLRKLKAITDRYAGHSDPASLARLGAQIAQEFSDEAGSSGHNPVLALPFAVPAGDPATAQLAGTVFTQVYGRLALTRRGHVGLDAAASVAEASDALAQARAHHAKYVVYGSAGSGAAPFLTVSVLRVADGTLVWSGSYPLKGADPAIIAAVVDSKVPGADEP